MALRAPVGGAVLFQTAQQSAVSVARMQALDREALERFHIPRLLLMEQAGFAFAQALDEQRPRVESPVLICCGMGFNGGDGLAAARHLAAWGIPVRVLLAGQRAQLREEPALFARILAALDVPWLETAGQDLPAAAEDGLRNADVIGDALLGLGVREAVREPLATLIRAMNGAGKPIVAADIPSGLNGDTGAVQGVAVRAGTTVTFGLAKQGCFEGQGPEHTGRLLVATIGLPRELLETAHG